MVVIKLFTFTIKGVNMATATLTKQEKVMNYLKRGRTLSEESAFSMFDVANLRATISDVRPFLKSQGFNVTRTVGRNGETRYGLTARKSCR
jgi:hypothetical protein